MRRILQPDRTEGDPSSFVLADGTWLELVGGDHLTADVWDLDAHLDEAERAEATGSPAAALASYGLALPLWRGEPFADLPYADSVAPTRARLRTRYVAAAVRAGELVLAAGVAADARHAAEHALAADPTDESAHNLLVRTFLAEGDHGGARRAVDACRTALAELGLEPTHAFFDLVALAREDPSAGR